MSKEFTSLIEDYQNRKVKRIAAIYSETDPRFRHLLDIELGLNYGSKYISIENGFRYRNYEHKNQTSP